MWKAITLAVVLTFGSAAPLQEAVASDAAVALSAASVKQPTPREYARRASRSSADYACLYHLWMRESHWNHKAKNAHSSAFGIAQMLHEKSKDPYKQIDHGLRYITERYGSACNAWGHWMKNGWY